MDAETIISHYHDVKPSAEDRLAEFKERPEDDRTLFKELTFCVFAANSSAEMGMKAVDLLEPVLMTGDQDAYQDVLDGKVRFYNVRSEYTAHNHDVIQGLDDSLAETLLHSDRPRRLVKTRFKGIGWKEASHFLRNTGHEGYCILDKHIRTVCHDIDILQDNEYPSSHDEYLDKEDKIRSFCEQHGLDVDVFDLAVWSYKTGHIAK